MFRDSMDGQQCIIPQVTSTDPVQWPDSACLAENFRGFVAHEYKGYTYYTGSDFMSPKISLARAAFAADALMVNIAMDEPDIAEAMANLEQNKPEYFQTDHITINLITPAGNRFLASINPLGRLYAEKNLQRDIKPFFSAQVKVGETGWNAFFMIPFAALGIKPESGTGLLFDIVRQEQSGAAISTLTRAAVTPPYNYIYEYPVFHFQPLYLDCVGEKPQASFADTCQTELISGNQVQVGEYVEPVIRITMGEYGLEPGARIRLSHGAPVLNCGVSWTVPLDWQGVQITNPKGAGYLRFDGAAFDIETNGIYSEATYVGNEKLPAGTEVLVCVGDRSQGGPGIKSSIVACPNHRMFVNIDPAGKGLFEPLEHPCVNVKNGPAVKLIVTNPGAVPGKAEFETVIRAVDHYGNICTDFIEIVILRLDAEEHSFVSELEFTPADRGVKIVSGSISSLGVYRFYVDAGAVSGAGNYLATDGSFGEGWILYGDVHCHTCTSDGWKIPEEKVVECRHLRGLQFMALADHDFDQSPEKWANYKKVVRDSDQPGRFIAFLAHEWTPSAGHGKALIQRSVGGHYVVLYPGFDGDLLRANDPAADTPAKLFSEARKQTGLMIMPHYHGTRPPVDPEISYAIEVAAWDGKICDEHTNQNDNKDLFGTLNDGYNLAVIAGVDHGGEGLTAFRNGEMFGVRADEFSREAILDGIKRRETIAIQHSRSLLNFTLNGEPMGSILEVTKDVPRKLVVKVACDPPAIHVHVIRNGKKIYNYPNAILCKGPIIDFEFTDDASETDSDWYLIRVVLHGGEILWSSPIRVNN
jgi:hypothetical protein